MSSYIKFGSHPFCTITISLRYNSQGVLSGGGRQIPNSTSPASPAAEDPQPPPPPPIGLAIPTPAATAAAAVGRGCFGDYSGLYGLFGNPATAAAAAAALTANGGAGGGGGGSNNPAAAFAAANAAFLQKQQPHHHSFFLPNGKLTHFRTD